MCYVRQYLDVGHVDVGPLSEYPTPIPHRHTHFEPRKTHGLCLVEDEFGVTTSASLCSGGVDVYWASRLKARTRSDRSCWRPISRCGTDRSFGICSCTMGMQVNWQGKNGIFVADGITIFPSAVWNHSIPFWTKFEQLRYKKFAFGKVLVASVCKVSKKRRNGNFKN